MRKEIEFEQWLKEAQNNFNFAFRCPYCEVKVVSHISGSYIFKLKQCKKHKDEEFPLTNYEIESRLNTLSKLKDALPECNCGCFKVIERIKKQLSQPLST